MNTIKMRVKSDLHDIGKYKSTERIDGRSAHLADEMRILAGKILVIEKTNHSLPYKYISHTNTEYEWYWISEWLENVHSSIEEVEAALSNGEITPAEYLQLVQEVKK